MKIKGGRKNAVRDKLVGDLEPYTSTRNPSHTHEIKPKYFKCDIP